MTRARSFCFLLVGLTLLLSGCSEYEFKFNDQPVYTPKPLFDRFHIADPALNDCVQQTILDKRATRVEQVTRLVCTNAGITSLQGLSELSHLEEVNLADNQIADIAPLADLPRLRRLDISNNVVEQVSSLMTLGNLERVAIGGNAGLECADAQRLATNSGASVTLPAHCD